MNLGDRIRELRLEKKMTQKDVVGEYMTRNMLSKIENGSATPSVRTLEHLAGALGVPVGAFMDGADEPVRPPDPPRGHGQLEEILLLTRLLLVEAGEQSWTGAVALCIQARAMMANSQAVQALELLRERASVFAEDESADREGLRLLYKALEDCSLLLEDYQGAYEYANRRFALEK